jgi:hypothetical protein
MTPRCETCIFDLAGAPIPELLSALLQIADHNHLHYGSDYPFTPSDACVSLLYQIEGPLTQPGFLKRIFRDNALNLFRSWNKTVEYGSDRSLYVSVWKLESIVQACHQLVGSGVSEAIRKPREVVSQSLNRGNSDR